MPGCGGSQCECRMAERICPGCRIHFGGLVLEVTSCSLTPAKTAQEGFCCSLHEHYSIGMDLSCIPQAPRRVQLPLYCSSWYLMLVTAHTTQHIHTCCMFASPPQSPFPTIHPAIHQDISEPWGSHGLIYHGSATEEDLSWSQFTFLS